MLGLPVQARLLQQDEGKSTGRLLAGAGGKIPPCFGGWARAHLGAENVFQEVSCVCLLLGAVLRDAVVERGSLSWCVCPKTCLKLAVPTFSVAEAFLTSCALNKGSWLSCLEHKCTFCRAFLDFPNFFLPVLDFLPAHFHFLKQLLLFLLPVGLPSPCASTWLVADGLREGPRGFAICFPDED